MKPTSKRTSASLPRSRKSAPRRAPLDAALFAFADVAKRLALRWYVFGAQAVNLHGFPRATADLDITVELGPVATSRFLDELTKSGFTARFADAGFIAATRVIPVVHDRSKLPIDLVLAGPGVEELFLAEVELHRIGRRQIPVLTVENLIVTKVIAGRAKDLEDVRELLAVQVNDVDHAHVTKLLKVIGAAIDEDLVRRFEALRVPAPKRRSATAARRKQT